jgi:uncharacterized protein (TIGR00369 family)
MQQTFAPPTGFARHDRKSPLTDAWEPIWARSSGDAVILGLLVGNAHVNSRGFAHGGLISALADNAMGLACGRKTGRPEMVTVSLSVDFLAAAMKGQWLEFDTVFVKPGSTLCFAQAFVTADGQPCARADAVFRVVSRRTAA